MYDSHDSRHLTPFAEFHLADDHNRVCLRGMRDDYINASYIKDIVPASPSFIATQAPLQPSIADFWLMVYEQQASIIAMLIPKPPTGKVCY